MNEMRFLAKYKVGELVFFKDHEKDWFLAGIVEYVHASIKDGEASVSYTIGSANYRECFDEDDIYDSNQVKSILKDFYAIH
jgi:hypothetical protein